MTKWKPCKRRDFVRRLKSLGFNGPFPGGSHKHMTYGRRFIPIPKESEYSVSKLREIMAEVEDIIGHKITADEWNNL